MSTSSGGGEHLELERLITLARGDSSELRVSIDSYNGREYVSARQWNKASDGTWRPDGKRGLSIKVRALEAVATALHRAAEQIAANASGKGGREA